MDGPVHDDNGKATGRARWREHPIWFLASSAALLLLAVVLAARVPENALWWAVPLVLGVLVLMIGVIFVFPGEVIRQSGGDDRAETVNSVRTTLIQAVGGVAAVFLGIFAYRQLIETSSQVDIAGRGQTDQVLTSAIGYIGDDDPVVRAGGAYVLRSLATDHPEYREVAYTLLANVIRTRSNTETLSSDPAVLAGQKDDRFVGQDSLRRRAPDVHAALEVLQTREELPDDDVFIPTLNDADLRGAVITAGDFRRADLRGARLDWADARGRPGRRGASFQCARLQGASLFGAHLEDSDFRGAQLDSATMTTPKSVEERQGEGPFLARAQFSDSTSFVDREIGRGLSTKEVAERLTALGMRHSDEDARCG